MKTQTFENNAIEIEVGRYYTIQKDNNNIFIVTFDTEEELNNYIERVCVSMGEDGHKDNFLYQSNQNWKQQEVQ